MFWCSDQFRTTSPGENPSCLPVLFALCTVRYTVLGHKLQNLQYPFSLLPLY